MCTKFDYKYNRYSIKKQFGSRERNHIGELVTIILYLFNVVEIAIW